MRRFLKIFALFSAAALTAAMLALPLAFMPTVSAEVGGNPSVSLTATATTVSFSTAYSSVTFVNGPDANGTPSPNELYLRVFWCGETPAAATTSSPVRLQPGDSVTFTFNPISESSTGTTCKGGYVGYSAVCASTETATLRWFGK